MRTANKVGLGLAVALVLAACAMFTGPARVTLYAQTLPAVVHAQWDPPAAAENVTGYTMTLDGGAPVNVPNTVDPACTCIRSPLTVPAFGAHTLNVVALNLLVSTDPTSTQSGAAASIGFTLAKAGIVGNGKVTK
jgi:hypothetical protein